MVELKTVNATYAEPEFERIKALKPDDMTWPEAIEYAFVATWGDDDEDDDS